MIDGLYWETLYNVGFKNAPGQKIQPLNCPFSDIPTTKPCPVAPADRNVMFENRMLGFPRLRMVNVIYHSSTMNEDEIDAINDQNMLFTTVFTSQLKMKNNSCEIEKAFEGAIRVCYAPYTNDKEKLDTEPFGLGEYGLKYEMFRKHSSEWA